MYIGQKMQYTTLICIKRVQKKLYFLDGPPYASGSIHIGTAWNKILKDTYLRYLTMLGYETSKQPGWDCHGLPIEVKVEQRLNLNSKKDIQKIGIDNFILKCKEWANDHIEIMEQQFLDIGVWLDWKNPYVTMKNDYIEAAWWTLKNAYSKDLLTNDFRVIFWCPRCETALAEHEVRGEYKNIEDPSIFIKFKLKSEENTYFIVWTTTPWTLPANVAITAHPEQMYAKVKVDNETWIIIEPLVDTVMSKIGIHRFQLFDLIVGRELSKKEYIHPLFDEVPVQKDFLDKKVPNIHSVVLDEMVTVTDGTGLVHTAPGHGEEDFNIGKKYGLPIFNPVNEKGFFNEDGGKYCGIAVKDANDIIAEDLKKRGLLLKYASVVHSYPHCWRCKSPLIFRATEQWFLKISSIKNKILEENKKNVTWFPSWVYDRYVNGVENVGDWCISRQRYWGIPLPIWRCECGKIEVISSKEDLASKSKCSLPSDMDLHRPNIDNIYILCSCSKKMTRIPDVLDVWFDSGIASWASLGYPKSQKLFKEYWPADFITEGHDQVTKWFYSQQASSVICFDTVPYSKVLMHGFALDSEGRKMSKSLGNVVAPKDISNKYGVDVTRFYFLWASAPWEDLKFNWDEINVVQRIVNVLWNICSFTSTFYSLDDFSAKKSDPTFYKNIDFIYIEDKWILSSLNSLIKEVNTYILTYEFHKIMRSIQRFILDDFSRGYIKFIRRRVWSHEMTHSKKSAYNTLYYVISRIVRLLAPSSIYLSEYIHLHLLRTSPSPPSIHLDSWPKENLELIDTQLEEKMKIVFEMIEKISYERQKANRKLRWPVVNVTVIPYNSKVYDAIKTCYDIFKSQVNAFNITLHEVGTLFENVSFSIRPNLKILGPKYKKDAQIIANAIEKQDAKLIKENLDTKKSHTFVKDGQKYTITPKDVDIVTSLPPEIVSCHLEHADLFLDTTITDEVIREGMAAEIVRRINDMRKDMNLDEMQQIIVTVDTKSDKVDYIKDKIDYIRDEVRAKEVTFGKSTSSTYEKEWDIDGDIFRIFIRA